jgi:tetratricopeptide (TPR) repeat protein
VGGSSSSAWISRPSRRATVEWPWALLSGGAPPMSSESDSADLQRAKTLFQYGNDATIKSNLDYAIDMYRQACKLVPDNMMFRQALRSVERKKFNNDPSKVGKLTGARNQPILLRAKAARSKGNYHHALEVCEEAFVNNPWDVSAARVAAESAEQLGLNLVAQWYVESVQMNTKDVDFLKFAARIHELNESWQKAIGCWELVKKFHPNDQDANRQINALSASSTIKRARLEDSLDRHAQAPVEPAESLDSKLDKLKQEQLSPEQRLIKEIIADSKAIHAYLDLAELYRGRSELDKAEKVLAKAIKANPNEPVLMSALEDTQIGRLKRAIEKQTQVCHERPDDTGAKVKLDQLNEMFNKYEVEAFRRRVNLRPEDAASHLQLGMILQRIGQHDEAIPEFQAARSSPATKIKALYHAGLSFEANSAWKLAERSYKEALKGLEEEDRENFLAMQYRLGRVAEAVGNTEAAGEHYNEVAAIDYTYLDVAERLRRL